MNELTNIDRRIIQLMADGLTTREIADKMIWAVPTIETYRHRLFKKIGVRNAPQCVAFGFRNGIVV